MSFSTLKKPNPVSKLGELIASIYHVSQGNYLDKFKYSCFSLINQFVPIGESYWIIEGRHLKNDIFCFSCKRENTQYDPTLIKYSDYSGIDSVTRTIKMNECKIQHFFYFSPGNTERGFTPKNQVDLDYIVSHMVEAYRLNVLSSFQKNWQKYPHGNAIFERDGTIIERDENFKQFDFLIESFNKNNALDSLECNQQYFLFKQNLLCEIQKIIDIYFMRIVNFSGDLITLSNKEKEICFFLIQAYSNKDIADKLHVSVKTIENHLANIYLKTTIQSRAKLTSALFDFN